MVIYSHSRLSCFENCPLQYKFKYIDKIKTGKESIEAFMGKLVHETLERLYSDREKGRINKLQEVLIFYNNEWQKKWNTSIFIVKNSKPGEYKEKGEKYLADFYTRFFKSDESKTVFTEKEVCIDLDNTGEYKMTGIIDRLSITNELFEVRDYKTGEHLLTQEKADLDRQLALYSIAVQQNFPNAKDINLVWHYLAFGREIQSKRSERELANLKEKTINLIKKIESTKEFKPKVSMLCKWCEYNDKCSSCQKIKK